MAQLSEINTALVQMISAALASTGLNGMLVGSEWPAKDVLQDVGNGGPPVVAVIHKTTNYQSRNMRFQHSSTTNPISIVSTVSDFSITPGQHATLTLSLAVGSTVVNQGDLVSLMVSNGDMNDGAMYSAVTGETLNSMATAFAAAIHTKFPTLGATASGAVITITNNDSVGYRIASNVGNVTYVQEAVKWASRSMQINAWTGNLTTKFLIQQAIEQLLTGIDDAEGFALPSGEWVMARFHGAKPNDDDVDKDIFGDLYLLTIDNMVDLLIEKYSVVAPITGLT